VIPHTIQPLVDRLARADGLIVAFSGGVDSSVVAAAAQLALGGRVIISTRECERSDYQRNDSERCFFCKSTLYESLDSIRHHYGNIQSIASGTNADDLGDYRPGLKAGQMIGVLTPLADLGWGKAQVRTAARALQLSNAELPASPCLASRIAYGVAVTPQRLAKVEAAEALIRDYGFSILRVRLLNEGHGDVARIEVEVSQLPRLDQIRRVNSLDSKIRSLGFTQVVVDEAGFRSGKMNDALPILHS
jgi:pyridinium-3,5-biscarboxylic acid mononucleotide sulfurtransferase